MIRADNPYKYDRITAQQARKKTEENRMLYRDRVQKDILPVFYKQLDTMLAQKEVVDEMQFSLPMTQVKDHHYEAREMRKAFVELLSADGYQVRQNKTYRNLFTISWGDYGLTIE